METLSRHLLDWLINYMWYKSFADERYRKFDNATQLYVAHNSTFYDIMAGSDQVARFDTQQAAEEALGLLMSSLGFVTIEGSI